jgi:hypothetical protein
MQPISVVLSLMSIINLKHQASKRNKDDREQGRLIWS